MSSPKPNRKFPNSSEFSICYFLSSGENFIRLPPNNFLIYAGIVCLMTIQADPVTLECFVDGPNLAPLPVRLLNPTAAGAHNVISAILTDAADRNPAAVGAIADF
jgi:hypothetical protein